MIYDIFTRQHCSNCRLACQYRSSLLSVSRPASMSSSHSPTQLNRRPTMDGAVADDLGMNSVAVTFSATRSLPRAFIFHRRLRHILDKRHVVRSRCQDSRSTNNASAPVRSIIVSHPRHLSSPIVEIISRHIAIVRR